MTPTSERIAQVIGGIGAAVVVGHAVLGRAVISPVGAMAGELAAVAGFGLALLISRRSRVPSPAT